MTSPGSMRHCVSTMPERLPVKHMHSQLLGCTSAAPSCEDSTSGHEKSAFLLLLAWLQVLLAKLHQLGHHPGSQLRKPAAKQTD